MRETPSIAEARAKPRFRGGLEVTGPPRSERGLKLQKGRQELEKIAEKVQVIDQKVDLSQLSSRERARIRQLTGVRKAEEAFSITPGKPETSLERIKRLESRKRQIELAQKLKFKTPEAARAAGFEVITPQILKAEKTLLSRDGVKSTVISQRSRILVDSRPSVSNLVSQVFSTQEAKIIAGAAKQKEREAATIERSRKVSEFFRVIPGLRGDSFAQQFTRELLSFPTRATIGVGEQIAAAGEKSILTVRGFITPSTRKSVLEELKRAAKETPSEIKSSLDVTTPSGLANVLGLAVIPLPSALGKARAARPTRITADIVGSRDILTGKIREGSILRGEKIKGRFVLTEPETGTGTGTFLVGKKDIFITKIKERAEVIIKEREKVIVKKIVKVPKDVLETDIISTTRKQKVIGQRAVAGEPIDILLSKEIITTKAEAFRSVRKGTRIISEELAARQRTILGTRTTATKKVIALERGKVFLLF